MELSLLTVILIPKTTVATTNSNINMLIALKMLFVILKNMKTTSIAIAIAKIIDVNSILITLLVHRQNYSFINNVFFAKNISEYLGNV